LNETEETEEDVTWTDQNNINEFSRLNAKVQDWEDKLEELKV